MFSLRFPAMSRMASRAKPATRMMTQQKMSSNEGYQSYHRNRGQHESGNNGSGQGWSWGEKMEQNTTLLMVAPPAFCAATALGLCIYKNRDSGLISDTLSNLPIPNASAQASTICEYSTSEISKHNSIENGIWVTYGEDVYDITTFVEQHPGGEKIMLAAGGPLEPFWKIYTIHNNNTCVLDILKPMIIGKMKKGETFELPVGQKCLAKDEKCPYREDPTRHPAYTVNSKKPFDAEPPGEMLIHDLITPNEIFFVRNHLPVPKLQKDDYELSVDIKGEKTLKISLEDLKTKYKKHTVAATLQCAGNRRGEMGKFRKIFGALAGHAAISTAVWGGVYLRDVLLDAGIKEDDPNIKHIVFQGWDKDPFDNHYGASIPVEKAMNSMGDVMLAYEMNGVDLPPDHGYPVRVVCPGVIGARSVKWVKKITASADECQSTWQKNDYRSTHPSASWNKFDTKSHIPIYEWPVQSVICSPSEGQKPKVHDGIVNVRGYAWSGGGSGILRVDVSADQGKTWHAAELQQLTQRRYRSWAWTLWEADIPIPEGISDKDDVQLWCKAVDSNHNVQPDSISGIWNLRGFLNNTWHKINVKPDFIM